MSELIDYIRQHAERVSVDTTEQAANVAFFAVRMKEAADAETLRSLVRAQKGSYVSVDVFDGQEHSYVELGAWLGDQGRALDLIGLGAQLGLWDLLTPRTMLGDNVSRELELRMAGAGLISIQAKGPRQHTDIDSARDKVATPLPD